MLKAPVVGFRCFYRFCSHLVRGFSFAVCVWGLFGRSLNLVRGFLGQVSMLPNIWCRYLGFVYSRQHMYLLSESMDGFLFLLVGAESSGGQRLVSSGHLVLLLALKFHRWRTRFFCNLKINNVLCCILHLVHNWANSFSSLVNVKSILQRWLIFKFIIIFFLGSGKTSTFSYWEKEKQLLNIS